jgi:molybdopterin molybdotransferase
MLSLSEAQARILSRAEPGEAIEVPLPEALGLVLAEPVIADVDMPPFDRVGADGFALRATDAVAGAMLRVARNGSEPNSDGGSAWLEVGPEEAARVELGDALPSEADAVARTDEISTDMIGDSPNVIALHRPVERGRNVVRRGDYLRAGAELIAAGSRLRLPMIGLLAAQGHVHPICFRRIRVAVLAVGDHLVGPGDAPILNRERNAASATVIAPCLHWGATAHDLGTVAECGDQLDTELGRALTASVVVILGRNSHRLAEAWTRAGIEPVFAGVALKPDSRIDYGIVRDDSGRVEAHVFVLPAHPIGALTAVTLLIGPLIARLQGAGAGGPPRRSAVLSGPLNATDERSWAVPVLLSEDGQGRLVAEPTEPRGPDDLPCFAHAHALVLLPPYSGPWHGGEIVEVVPLDPCSVEGA